MEKSRFEQGEERLREMHGQQGVDITDSLGELGRYIVEFAYGDICNRGGLTLREREIATIAMLTCAGREPQLRTHIHAGLNVGLSVEEIGEVILQTVPYAGFPTAMNAQNILKEIAAEMA